MRDGFSEAESDLPVSVLDAAACGLVSLNKPPAVTLGG